VGTLRGRQKVFGKKIPCEQGILGDDVSAQEQDENDERDRNPDKPEKNGHGVFSFRVAD
jgi:hypothetical protein